MGQYGPHFPPGPQWASTVHRFFPSLGLFGVIVVIDTEVVVASHGIKLAVVLDGAVVVWEPFDWFSCALKQEFKNGKPKLRDHRPWIPTCKFASTVSKKFKRRRNNEFSNFFKILIFSESHYLFLLEKHVNDMIEISRNGSQTEVRNCDNVVCRGWVTFSIH